MKDLKIGMSGGKAVRIPPEAATQTFAIVAIRGAGKTNTAVVMCEGMNRAGTQVVVLDPTDVWWGIRSSADGKGPGLPVYVFGGEHGDLPLDAAAGKLIADTVVEQGISCVLSLRHLSKSAQRRFVADFAERLYERKGEGKYRTPLHLFVDEADAFAPQRVMAETARMLGAIDDIMRRGRNTGFGLTCITQRPATLNKDILTQAETMIALRIIAPQDRKALDEWILAHDSEGRRAEFMGSLAMLERGEAWIWSPAWLKIFERVQISQRTTFDSSFTPKAGEKPLEPARLADVDLDKLREKMRTVVEEQEANDPKKLRAKIAELERTLTTMRAKEPSDGFALKEELEARRVEDELRIARLEERLTHFNRRNTAIREYAGALQTQLGELQRTLEDDAQPMPVELRPTRPAGNSSGDNIAQKRPPPAAARPTTRLPENGKAPSPSQSAPTGLSGPEQRVLDAIAWMESLGVEDPAQQAVCFLAGYTWGGGYFKPRGQLLGKGLVTYLPGDCIALTDEGRQLAAAPDAPPSRTELHNRVLARLKGPERRVLEPLLPVYPHGLAHEQLAAAAGYTLGGGYFKPRGRLKSWGLVEYFEGGVRASEVLFPAGLT